MKKDNIFKMEEELVSIICPIYNAENFISETINSVINQNYKNWELILIDDCSKDKSSLIIKIFQKKDLRIKYHKLERNSGAAIARNTGLKIAKGDYIAFIDSDDLWTCEKLEKQMDFMRKNNIGFSFTQYELIDEYGKSLNKIMRVEDKVDYKFLLKNTVIGCSTVIVNRKIIGFFEMPNIRTRQDNATWLYILRNGNNAYGLDETLTKYRVCKNSISRNKFKAAAKQWYVYRRIEKLSLIKSIGYFGAYGFNAVIKRV